MIRLSRLARFLDRINEQAGRWISWTVLALVVLQFTIVVLRYIFREGSIILQEALLYFNGLMFLGACGYTLLHNAHVRVDLKYRGAIRRYKALVNFWGTATLLIPILVLKWWVGVPYVLASWQNLEGSAETTGIPAVFLLKSFILLFAAGLTIQAISLMIHSWLQLKGVEHGEEEESGMV